MDFEGWPCWSSFNFVRPTRNGKGCAYVLNVILARDEEEVEREQQTFHCHVYVPRETHDSHDKRVELASTTASSIYLSICRCACAGDDFDWDRGGLSISISKVAEE